MEIVSPSQQRPSGNSDERKPTDPTFRFPQAADPEPGVARCGGSSNRSRFQRARSGRETFQIVAIQCQDCHTDSGVVITEGSPKEPETAAAGGAASLTSCGKQPNPILGYCGRTSPSDQAPAHREISLKPLPLAATHR